VVKPNAARVKISTAVRESPVFPENGQGQAFCTRAKYYKPNHKKHPLATLLNPCAAGCSEIPYIFGMQQTLFDWSKYYKI